MTVAKSLNFSVPPFLHLYVAPGISICLWGQLESFFCWQCERHKHWTGLSNYIFPSSTRCGHSEFTLWVLFGPALLPPTTGLEDASWVFSPIPPTVLFHTLILQSSPWEGQSAAENCTLLDLSCSLCGTPHTMTTPLTSDGKFNFGNCAGSKHTEKEKTLSPTSGRPGRTTHSTERQGRLLLSSVSIDFITHSPGNQKIQIHPPTMGEKPGGLQEDCREKLSRSVLCAVA